MAVLANRRHVIPAGDSSGNLKLNNANRLVLRFVARKTGTLSKLWMKVRALPADGASYVGGTTANWLWEINFHPVKPDGTYDPATTLRAAQQFNPNTKMVADGTAIAAINNGQAIGIDAGFNVIAGTEYAMTAKAANAAPATDYASLNFLYTSSGTTQGVEGANGRNERNTTVADAYYPLDPRETLGGSSADGSSQWYPGNNFNGVGFAKHLPVYIQEFSDGTKRGQPYFSGSPLTAGTAVSMVFKPQVPTLITRLAAFFNLADTIPTTLLVNGTQRAVVSLSGTAAAGGRVAEAPITPVIVVPGDVVKTQGTVNVTGSLTSFYSDTVFRTLIGNQTTSGPIYYEADAQRVVPLMPVGWQLDSERPPAKIGRRAGSPLTRFGF